jgi:Ring finger domain
MDCLFSVPLTGLRFLGFECIIGLFSSMIISFTSLVYLAFNSDSYECDKLMTAWLYTFATLRLVDIPIKLVLLNRVYQLSKRINHEDRRFMTRRLMDLVRGTLFTAQSRLNLTAYFVFIFGILRLRYGSTCQDNKFSQFCSTVMLTFTVRLIIGIVNYQYEERKAINRGGYEFTQFYKHGANLNSIENVTLITVDQENIQRLRDMCAICTESFEINELVRLLPCSSLHNFHKDCIDRWLIQKDACPMCGKSITKGKTS